MPDESDQMPNSEAETITPPVAPAEATPTVPETTEPDSGAASDQPMAPKPPKHRFHLRWPRPERLLPGFLRQRLGRAARFIALGLLVVIIGSLGFGGWLTAQHLGLFSPKPVARFKAHVTPFQVISTIPADGETDVVNGSQITIDFNRAVTPDNLKGDFFTSPQVDGTFKQGASNKEVIFTPTTVFAEGTIVKIMIHREFQSNDGAQLGADYTFSFTMKIPDNGVVFQHNGANEIVGSAPAKTAQDYSLSVGADFSGKATVTIYASTMSRLLNYLAGSTTNIYDPSTLSPSQTDTSALTSVQVIKDIVPGSDFTVSQDKGVYFLVARDATGHPAGYSWLVVSSFGVLARQDDQKIVLMAQDFATNSPVDVTAQFYDLTGAPSLMMSATVSGMAVVNAPYAKPISVIVAETSSGEQTIVPLHVANSLADIRVAQDLSQSSQVYAVTDKPTYAVGDIVHFAGFVRTDNDVHYTEPANGTPIHVYVGGYGDGTSLVDLHVPVNGEGVIAGSFKATRDMLGNQTLSATGLGQPYDQAIASFRVVKEKQSADDVHVTFAKASYLASDTIHAKIHVIGVDGTVPSGGTAQATIYARTYYEQDAAANQQALGSLGDAINKHPITVYLDGHGTAIVPIDVSKLPSGSSQVVTVQVSLKDSHGVTAAGGASTIVHEGDGLLQFGSGRDVVSNNQLTAHIYALSLDDSPLSGATIDYKVLARSFDTNGNPIDKTIATGETMTDSTGLASVAQTIPNVDSSTDSIIVQASTSDAHGNKITAENYYYEGYAGSGSFSDLALDALDIYGAPNDVSVGQTLHLTVVAPTAIHALVTLERGRIYKQETIDLQQGSNAYDVTVTPDLAPSFQLAFSFFSGGTNHVEGASYDVSPVSKLATVQLTTDKASYAAGQTAAITVSAHDASNNPFATDVIFGVVDANLYNLNQMSGADIFTLLYGPRDMTITSSSSLTGVGTGGGGRCGGGGFDQPDLPNPLGSMLFWDPMLVTNGSGAATEKVKLPKGTWRIYAYSMSSDSIVGSAQLTVNAQ